MAHARNGCQRDAIATQPWFEEGKSSHRTADCIAPRRSSLIGRFPRREASFVMMPARSNRESGMAPTDSFTPEPNAALDELIERCLAGDQQAWAEIVRLHWRKVFNLAYKFVGRHDEAEDLTQDIFLRIFKALHTFDRRANFQTWLISISRNLCIDHYRSRRKERETMARDVDASTLAPPSREKSPDGRLEELDVRDLVRTALSELAPALREAVVLRDLQDFSYLEIAERLGLPEGTVKSRINRGRLELARQVRRLQAQKPVPKAATGGGME